MHARRVGIGLAFAVAMLVSAAAPGGTPVWAATFGAEEISTFTSDVTIEPSGALLVHETIVYDFGTLQRHGIYRDLIARVDYPDKPGYDRVYPLTVLSVHGSPGTPDQYTEEEFTSGDVTYARIKIGDPDQTITGVHTYDITYRMRGVLNGFPDHDELVWNVNGVNWPVFILATTATVHAPAAITDVGCATGRYGATLPCASAAANGDTATFTAKMLGPFSNMTYTVGLPKGAVPAPKPILRERFNFASAFRVTPNTGGIAVGLLVLLVGAALVLGVVRRS